MPSLTEVGSLYIAIRASADGLKGDIQNAVDDAKSVMEKGASALAVTLGATLAAGMAAVSAAFIKGYNDIDNLSAAASKLGTSTAGLAEMQYAAEQTDTAFETLTGGLTKLQENLATAITEGKGGVVDALRQLNLDANTLRMLAPEDQIGQIADALSQVNNNSTRIALAKELFGKAGPELMNFMMQGRAGLEEMSRQAQILGLTISEAAVAGVAEFDKLEVVIQNAGKGFFRQFTAELAPAFKGLSDSLLQAIQNMGGMQSIAQSTANAVVEIVAFLADAANGAKLVFDYMQAWLASLIGVKAAADNWILEMEQGFRSKVGRAISDLASDLQVIGETGRIEANKIIDAVNGSLRTVMLGLKTLLDTVFKGIADQWNKLPFVDKIDPSIGVPMPIPQFDHILPQSGPTDDSVIGTMKLFGQWNEGDAQKQIQASRDLTNAALDNADAFRDKADATLEDIKAGNSWGNQIRANITANRAAIAAQTAEAIKGQQIGADALMKTADEASKAGRAISEHIQQGTAVANQSLKEMQDLNQRTIVDMATAWATGTGKMSDIFAQWGQSVIRQLIQVSLFGSKLSNGDTLGGIIPAITGGLSGGGGGFNWGSVISGIGSLFGGFFADGGDITGGKAYVVGERGPEVFRPRGSGTIIPNHKLRSMGGGRVMGGGDAGPPVVINQMFQSGITRAEVASMIDQVDDRTRAAVLTAHNQGGSFRRTLRS